MILASILAGAICGAIGALIIGVIAGWDEKNKSRYALVFAVIAVAGGTLSHQFLAPHLQAYFSSGKLGEKFNAAQVDFMAKGIDQQLAAVPAFAALKEHDPAIYKAIQNELAQMVVNGKAGAQGVIKERITQIVQQRLPRASNEAALRYIRAITQEMRELQQKEGHLCFRFLYPRPGDAFNITPYISKETAQADLEGLSEVIRTSARAPQAVPTESEVAPFLAPINAALAEKYGQDLSMLSNPHAPGVDKDKVCEMMIDLYGRILAQPPEQGGRLVRYMLAS